MKLFTQLFTPLFTQFVTQSSLTRACLIATTIGLGYFGTVQPATAFTFDETTDAGIGMSDATAIGEAGGVSNVIRGNIDSNRDIDVFKFDLPGGMTTFNGTPDTTPNSDQLNINFYLLNAAGNVISDFLEPVDEDFMSFSLDIAAGTYFLGIGSDDMDVFGVRQDGTEDFIAGNDIGVLDAQGVFRSFRLLNGTDADGNAIGESRGRYTITIDNANATDIPTPALFPGLVLLGARLWRRRRTVVDQQL
jgi:uncharacterized protein (TIGR03382 family)